MPAATLLAHAALLAGLAQAPAYPFAVGETLQYEATLGYFPIGSATAAVARTTRERGSGWHTFCRCGWRRVTEAESQSWTPIPAEEFKTLLSQRAMAETTGDDET